MVLDCLLRNFCFLCSGLHERYGLCRLYALVTLVIVLSFEHTSQKRWPAAAVRSFEPLVSLESGLVVLKFFAEVINYFGAKL